jgi:uncharacterized membrane protein YphA (DoxX/SURF4 family)
VASPRQSTVAVVLTLLAVFLADAYAGADQRPTARPKPSPRVVRVLERDGFHWGDAAVGGGVVLGLALLGTGAWALTARRAGSPPREEGT